MFPKFVQQINFEGVWGKSEAKDSIQRQSWTNSACEIVQYGKIVTAVFQQFSASIKKTFSLGKIMSTRLEFYDVLIFA